MVFMTILATPLEVAKTFPVAAESEIFEETSSKFELDLTSPSMISKAQAKNQITPDESVNDREIREKAEAAAAAKAKAEADAKAKADAEAIASKNRDTISRERKTYKDPSSFDEIYARAESAFGVDRKLLKAVHIAETGASGSTYVQSYAGAIGPMQFLPSTFRRYAVDGNNDGVADISNVEDAIFSAAKYLKACGYPDMKKALWGYNPSTAYYNKVTRIYNGL